MTTERGRDIGPDEIYVEDHDLEMDLAMEDPSSPTDEHYHSQFTSSLPSSHLTRHHIYGTNQTVVTRHYDEPLDMTPDDTEAQIASDAEVVNSRTSMLDESYRLRTFNSCWPSNAPVLPCDLARNGFYYTKIDDKVKCVFCSVVLKNWAPGDIVEAEHRSFSPQCPVHKTVSFDRNLCISGSSLPAEKPQERFHSQAKSLGVETLSLCAKGGNINEEVTGDALGVVTNKPKHPRYALESVRLATFKNWPTQMKQTPEDMAKAGLFYLGRGDRCQCFTCGGLLHSWEPSDDPMSEHKQWFPDCAFVQLVSETNRMSSGTKSDTKLDDQNHNQQSTAVQALIDTGYSIKDISAAIKKLHLGGVHESKIPTASDILDIILENDGACGSKGVSETLTSELKNDLSPSEEDVQHLMDENQELKEQRLCKVCLDNEISVIFLPCGHLACCTQCATSLRECPICRNPIKGTAKAYWA